MNLLLKCGWLACCAAAGWAGFAVFHAPKENLHSDKQESTISKLGAAQVPTIKPNFEDPFLTRLKQAEASEYQDLWEEIETRFPSNQAETWKKLLCIFWARKSPQNGYEFVCAKQYALRTTLVKEWLRVRLEEVRGLAPQMPGLAMDARTVLAETGQIDLWKTFFKLGPKDLASEEFNLLKSWAEKNPETALEWCQDSLPKAEMEKLKPTLLGAYARTSPEKAWELATGIDLVHYSETAKYLVIKAWVTLDLKSAMSAYESGNFSEDSRPKKDAANEIFQAINASQGSATAIRWILEQRDRGAPVSVQLAKALPGDPAKILSLLSEFQNDPDLVDALAGLKWEKPEEAASKFLAAGSKALVGSAIAQWWGRDQAAALTFMQTLPDDQRAEAWKRLGYQQTDLVAISPETVAAMNRDPSMVPEEMLQKLSELGELPLLNEFGIAPAHIGEALTLATLKMRNDEPGGNSIPRKVFANQLASDPAGSSNYVTSVLNQISSEPSGSQAAVAKAMGEAWGTSDAEGASTYLNAQPPGIARDSLAAGLASSLAYDDPGSALAWAKTIQSTVERQTALQNIFKAWKDMDAAASGEAMNSLSSQDRMQVETQLQEAPDTP